MDLPFASTNMYAYRSSLDDSDCTSLDESQISSPSVSMESTSVVSTSTSVSGVAADHELTQPNVRTTLQVKKVQTAENLVRLESAEVIQTDPKKKLENELKSELKARLNNKPSENKSRTMINGRLLLKNIEDELKDEMHTTNSNSNEQLFVKSPSTVMSGRLLLKSIEDELKDEINAMTSNSVSVGNSEQSPRTPTSSGLLPGPRMRKYSYDQVGKPSTAQSRSFNLLKETLDNGLVQKDAVFHDTITKKSTVRRCSLNVTMGNYETAKIIEKPNLKEDTIPEEHSESALDFKIESVYKSKPVPRSMSLYDDRLMSPARAKAAFYLGRVTEDFSNDHGKLDENEELSCNS